MGYVSIPTDLTGKMNKTPDYDSGCFSITSAALVVKTHNLGTKTLLVKMLYGGDDTDCLNDGTSGTGYPSYENTAGDTHILYAASNDTIEIKNRVSATRYFRVLIWTGA